jgi:hypothetical protein
MAAAIAASLKNATASLDKNPSIEHRCTILQRRNCDTTGTEPSAHGRQSQFPQTLQWPKRNLRPLKPWFKFANGSKVHTDLQEMEAHWKEHSCVLLNQQGSARPCACQHVPRTPPMPTNLLCGKSLWRSYKKLWNPQQVERFLTFCAETRRQPLYRTLKLFNSCRSSKTLP